VISNEENQTAVINAVVQVGKIRGTLRDAVNKKLAGAALVFARSASLRVWIRKTFPCCGSARQTGGLRYASAGWVE
jgi:hypothetical protein